MGYRYMQELFLRKVWRALRNAQAGGHADDHGAHPHAREHREDSRHRGRGERGCERSVKIK